MTDLPTPSYTLTREIPRIGEFDLYISGWDEVCDFKSRTEPSFSQLGRR